MEKSLYYLKAATVILTAAFVACTAEIMNLPMGVMLDKNSITLIPGESITLYAEVIPDDAVTKTLSWSSSNPGVAMVDNGVVTALAEGVTTISVTVTTRLGQKKKSCEVTVAYPVRSVTIDKNAAFLSVGERLILVAEVLPADAPDKSMTWTSSDPEVAEVTDGTVTAKKAGTAIITVTTTVGKKIAACHIKIFAENVGKYMAMTMHDSQNVTIHLSGSGTAEIDWGDGSASETYTLSPSMIESISHNYSETSIRMITIEGDDITYLDCSNNQLTSLDVSKNVALTTLNCSNNPLLSLNVNNNSALTTLICIRNQLTNLDVSANTALENLNCSYNQLTNLDVNGNIALITLECARNQLTGLNVGNIATLEILNCSNNQIMSLDVNNHTGLTSLNCSNNQLINLIVSNNYNLTSLYCSDNQIINLDVNKNPALTILDCSNNQLTSMDVSYNSLTEFIFDNNQLISLDVSNTYLTSLRISNSPLEELIVSNNDLLETINCSRNQLTNLTVSSNFALRDLDCSNNQLINLNVNSNTNLRRFLCNRNQLVRLDVTRNTMLYLLDCQSNRLSVEAINDLLISLHNRPISWLLDGQTIYNKYICIYLNPGANGCDLNIVRNKGWEVFYLSSWF